MRKLYNYYLQANIATTDEEYEYFENKFYEFAEEKGIEEDIAIKIWLGFALG